MGEVKKEKKLMTTMAAKLKGKAQVIRSLKAEINTIKLKSATEDTKTGAEQFAENMYGLVSDMLQFGEYSEAEIRKLMEVCLKTAKIRIREWNRQYRKDIKAAAAASKKEVTDGGN